MTKIFIAAVIGFVLGIEVAVRLRLELDPDAPRWMRWPSP